MPVVCDACLEAAVRAHAEERARAREIPLPWPWNESEEELPVRPDVRGLQHWLDLNA
jgi:hypothetical protein